MAHRKTTLRNVRGQLDERKLREADLKPRHVKRPGPGFGLYVVHDTHTGDEEIVSAGSITRSLKPGEVVMVGSHSGQGGKVIISAAPVGQLGTALFAFPGLVGAERDALSVEEADPAELPAGTVAEVVTFTGFGFRQTPPDTFTPMVYDVATRGYILDPLVTLGAVTWISATEVEIPVTVSATAPEGHEIRLLPVRS